MLTLYYDKNLKGIVYTTTNGTVYYPSEDGLFHDAYYADGTYKSILTGYYTQTFGGNVYLQCTGGWWILQNDAAWSEQAQRASVANYSAADAQSLVDGIIANDMLILSGNLLCARYANKLTKAEKQRLYDLQTRLVERNNALKDQNYLTNIQQSYPEGYEKFSASLESFMQNPGIGAVVSTTAIIVVSAIVLASIGAAAYFAYKAYFNQSKEDVKYSKELTQILQSRLTEEEYAQLEQETAGLITKAKIKQTFSSNTKLIGYGLLVIGAFTVWNLIKGYRS